MSNLNQSRCGFIALLGRPNVGKSTLLNKLIGQKISITSRKPQTTRNQILGIATQDNCQFIYVDTPGIQQSHDSAIHRYMNRAAASTIHDVDVIVFLVDRLQWSKEDEFIVNDLAKANCPVVLAINKVDRVSDKDTLLPHIEDLSQHLQWVDIVPLSAKTGHNLDQLLEIIKGYLPQREFMFDAEQVTDRSMRFLAAELIREKIMRQLGEEVPHKVAVEIEKFEETPRLTKIDAVIWVERDGQKKIIIGKAGSRIKAIGSEARLDIEPMVENKVMLNLWVKVKSNWSDDDRMLKSLGFSD